MAALDATPTHGRLKIFLGMAAGVGKTYRMLQEGQAEAEAGRDVVIGYLEPHGRAETTAQATGLEVVPRRRVTYQDAVLEEMDLPGILARAPELCLIDELAHTNAPGVEHGKRHEDVADVLAAGIDVFSTVNVQHLESLNDQVAELTGTRVRETVPDEVLGDAEELVLIDLTPEALVARLRAGKVYPAERVEGALANFFRIEHLSSLREVALRQVAEEVEARRVVRSAASPARPDRIMATAGPQAIGERLLALVTPAPSSQRVVRRAWRSAQRLGADLDLLWVPATHEQGAAEREGVEALRRLAVVLGAHLLVEPGEDLVATVRRVARDRGTTYVLMGPPAHRSALRRALRPSLPTRLLDELPGIDVRIVADRTRREERIEVEGALDGTSAPPAPAARVDARSAR
ncbi:MAG: Osmosensitive channel His kinase sensor [Conexibacter sp.]|nr:Osmosensitive channel His kinase sensor [Conexibacter sp.]